LEFTRFLYLTTKCKPLFRLRARTELLLRRSKGRFSEGCGGVEFEVPEGSCIHKPSPHILSRSGLSGPVEGWSLSKLTPSSSRSPLTKLIVRAEHVCLLHAGPTLVMSSLRQCYHIIGGHELVPNLCLSCLARAYHSWSCLHHSGRGYAGIKYGYARCGKGL
jgi:hypothetical protein